MELFRIGEVDWLRRFSQSYQGCHSIEQAGGGERSVLLGNNPDGCGRMAGQEIQA